ncbi:MAG: hypothetical protein ACFFCL_13845 [Promethearchaeota archaeon]
MGKYSENYDKNLNFTKLIKKLKIPTSEIDEFVSLILKFQELFEHVFGDYYIKERTMKNQVYLIIEKKIKNNAPRIINISASHLKLFNDIIYTFKFIKRGKGFDITKKGSDLSTNLKKIRNSHPILFESHGNGVIYPSELGLKLGELIISYNKSNKEIKNILIENYTFIVEEDE